MTAGLDKTLAKAAQDPQLAGIVAKVETRDGEFSWTGSSGELSPESPFFIASVTKIYTAAMIFQLCEQKRLRLIDRLVDVLDSSTVEGLHQRRGVDKTANITVAELLAHSSGLPDYFSDKPRGGKSLESSIRTDSDRAWTFDDVLSITRSLNAPFAPGTSKRAKYSDTNHQLLGRIIEECTGETYATALTAQVLGPLGLSNTWLYTDPADTRPVPLRDGDNQLSIPLAMTSFGPDGGVVSTVDDLMVFLRAYFEGGLFDRPLPGPNPDYRGVFFPLQAAVGVMRFKLPRLFTPFGSPPELIGHSGLSGAFAFLEPNRGVYFAGTVNNLAKPSRSFRLMMRLLGDVPV